MNEQGKITRRETIRRLALAGDGVALCAASGLPLWRPGAADASPDGFLVEGTSRTGGFSVKTLAKKVFEETGGMGR